MNENKKLTLAVLVFSFLVFAGILLFNFLNDRCPPDINNDGIISFEDLNMVTDQYGKTCNNCPEDVNQDGIVDDIDLHIVRKNFGKKCGELVSFQ